MSKTLAAAVLLLLTPSLAYADLQCGKWDTTFSTLSGEGEAWNASFCVENSKRNLSFEATCTSQSINMRFMPELSEDLGQIDKVTVDYNIDGKSHLVETQMEELDGALAADMEAKSAIIEEMKAGKKLVISFPGKDWPSYDISLKGAKTAFTKLIKKCD